MEREFNFQFDLLRSHIQRSLEIGTLRPSDITTDKYFICCFNSSHEYQCALFTTDRTVAKSEIKYLKTIPDISQIYVERLNNGAISYHKIGNHWKRFTKQILQK